MLGREQVAVDLGSIATYLRNETVLVTGAGGSIGAELCRQIARTGCKRLILVDQAETPLFEIERELVDERGFPAAVPMLRDAGNRNAMRQVFERYTPGVVFHAAAYKHVPLMEANPLESVHNNALATRTMAEVSVEFGVSRFVLVSTDKAVNPKTVMGQSKALCEWIVEAFGARDDVATRFVAVRFGNVLGSSGSVITIFRRQIAKGGPVTVTHPEMTRFFMTIPEASSLVIQAGAIGGRGQVFVLDMGEPVEIVRNPLIRVVGRRLVQLHPVIGLVFEPVAQEALRQPAPPADMQYSPQIRGIDANYDKCQREPSEDRKLPPELRPIVLLKRVIEIIVPIIEPNVEPHSD